MDSIKIKINKVLDFMETDKWKKILRWIVCGAFLLYLLIGISAYASWFPGSKKIFVYSSTSGKILRGFISICLVGSGILTFITYRKKINYPVIILFGLLILFNLFAILVTPTSFYVIYKQTILYPFLSSIEMNVSMSEIILGFLSFSVDIIFGYLFLFVFPHSFDRKTFVILLTVFMAIMLYSCFYSYLKQTEYYKYFLSGKWEYGAESIGSIFGNKQQWGIFLAIVPPVGSILIWLISKTNLKKHVMILFYLFSIVSILCSFFCGLVAFCKTAIVCCLLFFVVLLICLIIHLFLSKTTRKYSILIMTLGGTIISFIVLMIAVPSLRSTKIGSLIYKIFDNLISRGEVGAESRLELIVRTMQNFPSLNLFVGIPKALVEYYALALVPELPNTLHSGIFIFFSRTGVFGTVIYLLMNIMLVINIIKLIKKKQLIGGLILGGYLVSIILNLSELEILIMSSSMDVFILNLICVILPNTFEKQKGVLYNEEVYL